MADFIFSCRVIHSLTATLPSCPGLRVCCVARQCQLILFLDPFFLAMHALPPTPADVNGAGNSESTNKILL